MGEMRSCEIAIMEPPERVLATLPRSFTIAPVRFELVTRGERQLRAFDVAATRVEGRWQTRWRNGHWWVDVLPVGPSRTVIGVTVRGPSGADIADLTRTLRDGVGRERPRVTGSDPAEHPPAVPTLWKTAST